MKEIYFSFILYYIFYISSVLNQENICDLDHFCDNCTYCGNNNNYCSCNFFNIYCLNSDSSKKVSYDFLRNYDGCITSNNNKEDICGESDILLSNDESKTITFPSTNSENILCYYNFRKSDLNNNKMSVILRKNGLEFPKFDLYYLTYNNNTLIRNGGISSSNARDYLEIIQNNCNKYSIYLHIEDPEYLNELSMTFYFIGDSSSETTTPTTTTPTSPRIRNESSGSSHTGLIIGLIVGGVALVVGIVIAIILINNYRKKKSKKVITNSSINELTTNNYNYNEFYNIINTNKEKMDNLFKTELLPITYTKNNTANDNYKCTICMEDFVENSSSVLTTKCGHTFHYKCFKNWTYKNIICPKCPNCNYLILGPESDINLENISVPADFTFQGGYTNTLGLTN